MTRHLLRSKSSHARSQHAFPTRGDSIAAPSFGPKGAQPRVTIYDELNGRIPYIFDDQDLPTRPLEVSPSHEPGRPKTSNGVHKCDRMDGFSSNRHPVWRFPLNRSFSPPAEPGYTMYREPSPEAEAEAEELCIGMALGSPREDQLPPVQLPYGACDGHSTRSYSTQSQYATPSIANIPEPVKAPPPPQSQPPTRQKSTSKWKLFGGMFGRKAVVNNSPSGAELYQMALELQPPFPVVFQQQEDLYSRTPTPEQQRAAEKERLPEEDKSRGVEERVMDRFGVHASAGKTAKPPNKAFSIFTRTQTPDSQSSPMLNVDIPSIELERYSVMFGNLLKPRQSSLLARRHAKLETLKPVDNLLMKVEQVTPFPDFGDLPPPRPPALSLQRSSCSPTFSLFPATPTLSIRDAPFAHSPRNASFSSSPRNATFSHSPRRSPLNTSPLQRSNTSPAALSPNRATFGDIQRPRDESRIVMMVHSPARDALTSRPPDYWTPHSPESVEERAESPAVTSEAKAAIAVSLKAIATKIERSKTEKPPKTEKHKKENEGDRPKVPEKEEPHFCATIAEEPSSFSPIPPPKDKKHSLRSRSRSQSRSQTSSPQDEEARIRTAAEISIARQISQSRQQRQLLLPIVPPSERLMLSPKPSLTATLVDGAATARISQTVEVEMA